jgi:hypothetical protein
MQFVPVSCYFLTDNSNIFLSIIIRQIKSRRMRWAGHVARMGEGRNVYRVLVGKPEGRNHLKDQGVDGRMGSRWTLGRLILGGWSGFAWLGIGAVVNAVMNLRVLASQN